MSNSAEYQENNILGKKAHKVTIIYRVEFVLQLKIK